jgi:hypothetical protein
MTYGTTCEPSYVGVMKARTLIAAAAATLSLAATAAADSTPLGNTRLMSTPASEKTCSAPLVENPFVRFMDPRNYVLAPDGSFEAASPAGWQLSGGAARVAEADAVDLGAGDGAGVLGLPVRAVAISPVMRVDLDYPTFRFLARALKAPDSAELRVEIAYPDASKPAWEELAKFDGAQFTAAGGGWRLTSDLDMKPDLGGKTAGFRRVAFRFTALSGSWRLDDLFVDPRRR